MTDTLKSINNLIPMETKSCAICGEAKPISEFPKNSLLKDGLALYCKNCKKEMAKTRAEEQRTKHPILVSTKFCRRCGKKKYASEFSPDFQNKDGLNLYCKACHSEMQKTRYWARKRRAETKLCRSCGEIKPTSEFSKHSRKKDGLDSYCKTCRKEKRKASPKRIYPVLVQTKSCGKCGETKPASEFYRDSRRRDGLNSYCKTCDNKKTNTYYKTEKGKRLLKKHATRYRDEGYYRYGKGAVQLLYHSAKKRGITVELTSDTLKEWWNSHPDECFYCGISLDEYLVLKDFVVSYTGGNEEISRFKRFFRNRWHKANKRMTIDRMDNNKGYEPKNMVKSCWICNSIKSAFLDSDQMKLMAPGILSKLKGEIEKEKTKQETPTT